MSTHTTETSRPDQQRESAWLSPGFVLASLVCLGLLTLTFVVLYVLAGVVLAALPALTALTLGS